METITVKHIATLTDGSQRVYSTHEFQTTAAAAHWVSLIAGDFASTPDVVSVATVLTVEAPAPAYVHTGFECAAL